MKRRTLVAAIGTAAILPAFTTAAMKAKDHMYGLIGQMKVASGKRAELIAILAEGTSAMPGCLSYVIAEDSVDVDSIWISEIWVDQAHHAASLALPSVKIAIAKGKPMITGFGHRFETIPKAGVR